MKQAQIDYLNWRYALKSNLVKGVHTLRSILADNAQARMFAENPAAVAVVLSYDKENPDGNAEELYELLTKSSVAETASLTYICNTYGVASFGELFADEEKMAQLLEDESSMNAIAASESAMTSLAYDADAMANIAASETAMSAINGSATAPKVVAGSSIALEAIAASSVAMNIIANNKTILNALASNDGAVAAAINNETSMQTIAASLSAMTALASGSTRMGYVAANETAMDVVASSQVATSAVESSSTAMAQINKNVMAQSKLLCGIGSVSSSGIGDIKSALQLIVADAAACSKIEGSSVAKDILASSSLIVTKTNIYLYNTNTVSPSASISGKIYVVKAAHNATNGAEKMRLYTSITSGTYAEVGEEIDASNAGVYYDVGMFFQNLYANSGTTAGFDYGSSKCWLKYIPIS